MLEQRLGSVDSRDSNDSHCLGKLHPFIPHVGCRRFHHNMVRMQNVCKRVLVNKLENGDGDAVGIPTGPRDRDNDPY